jgi:DNA-binding transcriptional MerR regulator
MGSVVEDYSTLQASKITGLTLRTLQSWSESGFIIPSVNSGKRGRVGGTQAKRWSLTDIMCLKTAGDLRRLGASSATLRKVNAYLRNQGGTFADTLLVVTESDVLIKASKDICISTLRQPGQTAPCTFIYDLEVAAQVVRANIEQLKKVA